MRDVGAALGINEGAAKMRVGRALNRLRTQLGVGTAACTVVVLSTILLEQPLQAAPSQLISRLAALRLPSVAPTVTGGFSGLLQTVLKSKFVALAAVLTLITIITLGLIRARNSRTNEISAQPLPDSAGKVESNPNVRRLHSIVKSTSQPPAVKPVKILFHVLDAETGVGLPGTKIHGAFFGPGGEGVANDTFTDQNGDAPVFEPADPTKKSGPNVFVVAEGHVPKAINFHGRPVPPDYTIRLDSAVTIGGRIVDEANRPVNNVKILVQGPGDKAGQIENIDFQTCPVMSDEDGSWSCSYIPKDYTNEIRLILKKPGFAPTFPVVSVREVNLTNLVLVIDRGFTVTGKITDAKGTAVSEADVRILSGDPNKRDSVKSDEGGLFYIPGVCGEATGLFSMSRRAITTNDSGGTVIRAAQIADPVHVDLPVQIKGFASQTFRVDLSQKTNVANVVLLRGTSLHGQLVDETGNPIAHAVVQTDYDFKNQIRQQFEWNTYTDANGYFEWNSAPTGEVCYWFEAIGYKVIRSLPLVATEGEHRIVLQSGSSQ